MQTLIQKVISWFAASPARLILLVAAIMIVGFGIVLVVSSVKDRSVGQPQPGTQDGIPRLPAAEEAKQRALASGVEQNEHTTLLRQTDRYQILYLRKFDIFLISILGQPFESARQEAEQDFLHQVLKTDDPRVACSLPVQITTPRFANPKFSGEVYQLSFCKR